MNELEALKNALIAVTEELEVMAGFATIVDVAMQEADGSKLGRDQLKKLVENHQLAALRFCELATDFLVKANKTSDALLRSANDVIMPAQDDDLTR